MVIDLPNNRCYLLGFADKKVVNNVKKCEKEEETQGSSIRQRGPKHQLDTCPENYVIRLTPARQYYVNNLDPFKIKLEMVGEIKTCFLYKRITVLDCTCLLETNKLCEACSTCKYNLSSAARLFHNRLFV